MANNIRVVIQKPVDGGGLGVTSFNTRTGVVVPVNGDYTTAQVTESTDKKYVTDAEKVVIGNTSGTNTGDQDISAKIESTDYAVFDTGGTLKARLDGTDLYLTNDGSNA